MTSELRMIILVERRKLDSCCINNCNTCSRGKSLSCNKYTQNKLRSVLQRPWLWHSMVNSGTVHVILLQPVLKMHTETQGPSGLPGGNEMSLVQLRCKREGRWQNYRCSEGKLQHLQLCFPRQNHRTIITMVGKKNLQYHPVQPSTYHKYFLTKLCHHLNIY